MGRDIVMKRVEEIEPHPFNKKLFGDIPEETKQMLKKSIEQWGVLHPIVLANDGRTILSGHQRWLAAKELGLKEVPCTVVDVDPFSPQATAILIEANLSQRTITVDCYTKCMEVYDGLPAVREREQKTIMEKLHPEYRKYLEEGKLPLRLARSLCCMDPEEQKQYRDIVELVVSSRISVNDVRTEQLRKLKKENEQLIRRIAESEKTIKRLEEAQAREKKEKQSLLGRIEHLSHERDELMKKISSLQEELEKAKLNQQSEKIKRQMHLHREELERKDREIDLLSEQIEQLVESIESLQTQLDRERRQNRELKRKFQEELRTLRQKNTPRARTDPEALEEPPAAQKALFILDYLPSGIKHVHTILDQLSSQQKQTVGERLEELMSVLEDVMADLKGNSVKYDYELRS